MDQVKLNKIKEILGHIVFQYSIIEQTVMKLDKKSEVSPNLLKFLISQNKREKEIIEILGGQFPDTGAIDNLNKYIRELENKNLQKGEVSFENILKYIQIQNKEISQKLKDKYGLNIFVKISMSSVIEVNFSNIKTCLPLSVEDYSYKYANSDKEQEALKLKQQKQYECAKQYFSFEDNGDILFNDKNYNTLIDIINNEFNHLGDISQIETTNRHSFEKSTKKRIFIMKDASFKILGLKSQLAFQEQISKL